MTFSTPEGFENQARINGVLHPIRSKPPANLDAIQHRINQEAPGLEPVDHGDYVFVVSTACNEATMAFELGHMLLREHPRFAEDYVRAFNQAFTGFPQDVCFNDGLPAPRPSFVQGIWLEEYRPIPVEELVSGAVLFNDNPFSPTLAHIAGEWKKNMEEARVGSAFVGAALVYARNQALEYIGKPDPEGHANVVTFASDGKILNLYLHYATPSGENGALQYHQYPLASANLNSSFDEYVKGCEQFRLAEDWAREQSYLLKNQVKQHWAASKSQLGEGNGHDAVPRQPVNSGVSSSAVNGNSASGIARKRRRAVSLSASEASQSSGPDLS